MGNTFSASSLVLDLTLAEFQESSAMFDVADTQIAGYWEKNLPTWAKGQTVSVLKYPRYPVTRTTVSQGTDITINPTDIQQETETVLVDQLFFTAINLTNVEQKYYGSGGGQKGEDFINTFFIKPAVKALKYQLEKFIFEKFVTSAFIATGSPSSRLNSASSLSSIRALMQQNQMPMDRNLIVSDIDAAALTDTFGTYFNGQLNEKAIRGTVMSGVSGFDETTESEAISVVPGGTASDNSTLTLFVDAIDGNTNLQIDSLVVGETINVGSIITINVSTAFFVKPFDRTDRISRSLTPVTFVVQVPTGIDPNFTPGDGSSTNPFGVYTATGAQMTVIVNQVKTNISGDQYARIETPSDVLAAGSPISVSADRLVNMAISKGGISLAAPPLPSLAFVEWRQEALRNGFSMFVGRQGQLANLRNLDVIGFVAGCTVHPEYVISVDSAP